MSMETDDGGTSSGGEDQGGGEGGSGSGVVDEVGRTRRSSSRGVQTELAHIEICNGSIFNVDKEDCMRYVEHAECVER